MTNITPSRWGDKPYYSLDYYLKETFGEKVYRLSLNGGMTCPNRDGTLGTGGCIFCSAGGSGDFAADSGLPVSAQLLYAKTKIRQKTSCNKFIAYFQAYTNTYAPVSYLRRIFMESIMSPDIVALSIATRCDCLPPEVLDLLAELNNIKPVWIELGLQTIHDDTRKMLGSGFTFSQYKYAMQALCKRNITVITHLIIGLPGESADMMRDSVSAVATLPGKGIKLQLLHILKGTELGALYQKNPFPLFSLEEYCHFIVDLIASLPPDMVIHRLTGDGPRDLLLAPKWSTDKKRVLNTVLRYFREENTWQGKNFMS